MPTKLTLEDLEAMRQHYGIAQREAQREQIPVLEARMRC
jgi:hypothetical protein